MAILTKAQEAAVLQAIINDVAVGMFAAKSDIHIAPEKWGEIQYKAMLAYMGVDIEPGETRMNLFGVQVDMVAAKIFSSIKNVLNPEKEEDDDSEPSS